jgi:uncharacterized protein (TIGR02145 family)
LYHVIYNDVPSLKRRLCMSVFTRYGTALLLAAAIGAIGARAAWACGGEPGTRCEEGPEADTAYVPIAVSVDAAITAQTKDPLSLDKSLPRAIVNLDVTAGKRDTLRLPLLKAETGVLRGAQRRAGAAASVNYRAGSVTVNLSAQSYKNAEISLYSVNGKRVMRYSVSAASADNGATRRNVTAGVYLLSVKGTDGATVASRLTHRGGSLSVSAAFGGENASPARRTAKKAEDGDGGGDAGERWWVTVAAKDTGYADSMFNFVPVLGMNEPLNITLREGFTVVDIGGEKRFKDARDGHWYRMVTINGQTWMAQNLNFETSGGSLCYANSADSCEKYGRLYAGDTAEAACPYGWHLATMQEWDALIEYAGGNYAGKKLKSTTGWIDDWDGTDGNGTDDYGFTALPGGMSYTWSSSFTGEPGGNGYWWTAYNGPNRNFINMSTSNDTRPDGALFTRREYAFSVRCVLDGD